MFFFDFSTRFVLKFRLPDLDYPRFDQVLTIIGQYYEFLQQMFFLTFEPDLYSNSDSLTSITQGPIKSQPSLVTISEFLNRCSFDPDANRQTNKQTNFFHMTLLTVEGIKKFENFYECY